MVKRKLKNGIKKNGIKKNKEESRTEKKRQEGKPKEKTYVRRTGKHIWIRDWEKNQKLNESDEEKIIEKKKKNVWNNIFKKWN